MENNYTLHKLPQGFIITSDEMIKEESKFLDNKTIFTCRNTFENGVEDDDGLLHNIKCKKIIAQQPQIIFSSLKEEEQVRIGWFDVEKLTSFYYGENRGTVENEDGFRKGFPLGFQKAQELLSDRRFTEEDVMKAMKHAVKYYSHMWDDSDGEKIIQSLSQQSWKVECVEENGKIKILKLL